MKEHKYLLTNASTTNAFIALMLSFLLVSCSPTVKVEPPKEPITINLNVKIDHEVRVKIDEELEESIFSDNSDLF